MHNFGCFWDSGRRNSDVGVTADSTAHAGEQRAIHGAHSGLGLGDPTINARFEGDGSGKMYPERDESYPKLLRKPRTLALIVASVEGERVATAADLISARSKLLASSKSGLAASAVGLQSSQ